MRAAAWRSVVLAVAIAAVGGVGERPAVARQPPAAEAPPAASKPDPAAEFNDALGLMKKLMGDITLLQAQFQQPGADRQAIQARFEAVAVEADAANARLEQAAVALLAVDPQNRDARDIATGTVQGALEWDNPEKALATAQAIDAAGAGGGEVALLAAQAARVLSRPDEAEAWLGKAEEAKAVPAEQLAQLRAMIAADRPKVEAEMAKRKAEAEADDLPRVTLTTSQGPIVVELFENEAPNTVANFVSLVEKGFYDGTPFHRVIGGFMAQGGDPTGTGGGGPGHVIRCECGAADARLHFRGSLSMAHAGPDTGGSQFFLTFRPTDHLDRKHTVFGRVVEGFDVLPKLARTQDERGPIQGVEPDTIVKAEVLRKREHPYVAETMPDPRPGR